MPVRLNQDIRVTIDVGGEEATFVFPAWSDPKLQKAIDRMIENRVEFRRNRPVDQGYDQRVIFFDSMCQSCENVTDLNEAGEEVDVMTLDGWKKRIPPGWKVSCAAQFEERGANLSEDERGN